MQNADAEAVRAAQERVWKAANACDAAQLEELLDPAFLLVEADSLDRKSKLEFIRDISARAQEPGVLRFRLENVQVQLQGDMAVAYAQFHAEDEIDGERLEMSGNAVDAFVRRDSGWKLIGSVYGEVPPFAE